VSLEADPAESHDSGLVALTSLLRFHGIGVDPQQLRHHFGGIAIGLAQMLRYAKQTGLKARVCKTNYQRLAKLPLPGIATLVDGGFLLLGKAGEGMVLVQSSQFPRPQLMTQAEFEAVWDGRVILIARRAGLVDLARHFDVTWFLAA
jgi:ATP-binding cassette, subfamily B, bacterial HlyB/CyaB